MSGTFEFTGLFYEANGFKLRKFLDIKLSGTKKITPELMVIMMNPGSSYPLDGVDNNTIPSATKPDTTQSQIINVMKATSIEYARVLNLSDLRTPDSKILYKLLKSVQSQSVDHSIFSSTRKSELDKLFAKNVPVIFGWGVNPALFPLAKNAVSLLPVEKPLGIKKANSEYSYYHPLPRVHSKQLEWVEILTKQLNMHS